MALLCCVGGVYMLQLRAAGTVATQYTVTETQDRHPQKLAGLNA